MSDITSVSSSQKTIDQIISANEKNKIGKRNTGELGKDDFLQLLITQLQHQDPMNPSSDQEFIAQIAQFSSLEQMKNMNSSVQQQQGFAMMGKYISAVVTDEVTGSQRAVSGEVTSVKMFDGIVKLMVGEDEVDINGVAQVADTSEGVGGQGDITKYNTLIGLMGTSSVSDKDGKTTDIEGIVSKIDKRTSGIYATLDEVNLEPVLDKGAFATVKEYLDAMTGREVPMRVKDAVTGADLIVRGTLREYETAADGTTKVVLDGVEAAVGTIHATRRVDLFSSEQLLLAQILETLRETNDTTTGAASGTSTDTASGTTAGATTDANGETSTDALTGTAGGTTN